MTKLNYKWTLIALVLMFLFSSIGTKVFAFSNLMPDNANDIKDSSSTQSGTASLVSGQSQFVRSTSSNLRIWFKSNSGSLTLNNYNFCDSDRSDFVQAGDYFASNDITDGSIVTVFTVNGKVYYGKKYQNTDTVNCHASFTINLTNLQPDSENGNYYFADIIVTHNDLRDGNCNNSGISGCDGIMNYYNLRGSTGSLIGVSKVGSTSGHAITMDQTDNTPKYLNYIARFGLPCTASSGEVTFYFYDMDNGGGSGGAQIGKKIQMALADETTNDWIEVWNPDKNPEVTYTLYEFPDSNNTMQKVSFNAQKGHKYRMELRDVYYNNTIQYSLPASQINYQACPAQTFSYAATPNLTVNNSQVFVNDTTDNTAKWTFAATVTDGPSPNIALDLAFSKSGSWSGSGTLPNSLPANSNQGYVATNLVTKTFTTEGNYCYVMSIPKGQGTMNQSGAIVTSSQTGPTNNICVDVGHKWAITPIATPSSTVIPVGGSVTWTYSFNTDKGPTPNFAIPVGYRTSQTVYSFTQLPNTVPAKNPAGNNLVQTMTKTYNSVGKFCEKASLPDYASGNINSKGNVISNNGALDSQPSCVTVGLQPTVQVLGGDLNAGKTLSGTSIAKVKTSQTITNGKTYGSWGEYGVLATGQVIGMASGAGLAGGSASATNCTIALLTFANTNNLSSCTNTSILGSYTFKSNTKNMSSYFTSGNPTINGNLNSMSGVYYNNILTSLTIGNSVNLSNWIVVNVPNADVTISGNISYANKAITDLSQLPQVIIIAKNIYINSNVSNIDAWLVAQNGIIKTCADAPAQLTIGSTCSQTLRINGPLIAGSISLLRSGGSGGTGDVPAETFNLRSDAYLWAYARSKSTTTYKTAYVVELPPRL